MREGWETGELTWGAQAILDGVERSLLEGASVKALWSLVELGERVEFRRIVEMKGHRESDASVALTLYDEGTGEVLLRGERRATAAEAYQALYDQVRARALVHLRQLEPPTDEELRRERMVLMGLLDVHASELSRGLPEERWVRGRIDCARARVELESGDWLSVNGELLPDAFHGAEGVVEGRLKVRFAGNHPQSKPIRVLEVELHTPEQEKDLLDELFSEVEERDA